MNEHSSIAAGTRVAAAHRGTHTGVVLARDDPRGWTDTLAFPGRAPSAPEVRAHLDECAARGLPLPHGVPVRWCFGMTDWETPEVLREAHGTTCRCLFGLV